jgi:signal transduction histidine kinase
MGGNVHFLTGSILAWLFLRLYGPWVGIASAAGGALSTIYLWGHPFGAITTVLEFVFVISVVAVRARYASAAHGVSWRPIAIIAYWAAIGIPLVTALYTTQLDLELATSVAIGFKQAVNGVANMLIAEGLLVLCLAYSPRFRRWRPRKLGASHLVLYTGGLVVGVASYLTVAFLSEYLLTNLHQAQRLRLNGIAAHAERSLVSQIRAGVRAIELAAQGGQEIIVKDVRGLLRRSNDGQWLAVSINGLDRDRLVADLNLGVRNSFVAGETIQIFYLGEWAIAISGPIVDDVRVMVLSADEADGILQKGNVIYPGTTTSFALVRVRDLDAFGIMRGMELGSDWVVRAPNEELAGHVAVLVPSSDLLTRIWQFQLRLSIALFTIFVVAVAILSIIGRRLSDQPRFVAEEITQPQTHSISRQASGPFLTVDAEISIQEVRKARKLLDDAFNAAVLEGRALVQMTDEMRVYLIRIVGGDVMLMNRRFTEDFQFEVTKSRILSGLVRDNIAGPGHWRFTQPEIIGDQEKLITWDVNCTDEARGAYTVTGVDVTEERQRLEKSAFESKLASLGTLAAGFAHEINQPLNVIMMANSNLARRLRLTGGDEAALEKTERISQQVKRAASFVQNLRRLSKDPALNSGGGGFLLSEAIENAIDVVQGQFALEDVAIERDIDPGLIAEGSDTQLDQVIVNLLTNARDALVQSKPQNPTIWLSARMVGTKILVHIRDNAGGIPCEKIDRIFEPFFTTKETGTGLGLALSRQIIASIGGRIDVINTEVGAQFTLELQPLGQDLGRSKES